jgi:hypothetical protein
MSSNELQIERIQHGHALASVRRLVRGRAVSTLTAQRPARTPPPRRTSSKSDRLASAANDRPGGGATWAVCKADRVRHPVTRRRLGGHGTVSGP